MKLARDTQALERGHLDNPTNVTRGALRRYLALVLMLPVFLDGNAWDSRSNHVRARGCSVLAADVGMRCYHASPARRRTAGGQHAAIDAATFVGGRSAGSAAAT